MIDTPTMPPRKLELWGLEDVAGALGITAETAAVWRHRGKLPEPDWIVSGRPVWNAAQVRRWIERQGGGSPQRGGRR